MPPTIQTNLNAQDKRPVRPGEKRSELVCRVKYCNTLPDIPFDPKFITYPFDSIRFIQYNPTSLERNYKYEVLTEPDMGVTIDLINRDTYTCDAGTLLDPADEKLLEEDVLTPQDSKRSRHHARSVSWLRRTEYISTEQTRFQPQSMDKVEAKVGYSIKKTLKEETLYMDRESQIKAIERTFQDTKLPIEKHYSKPNIFPVEVMPVFPDFKVWKYPCAQVIFDSDPAPAGRPVPVQIEEMSQAMIRGVMDESGEQFVAYFLPTDDTLEKRRLDFTNSVPYVDDEEYDYKMAREYNWNVKNKASKGYEENYFLIMRPDGVFYNELETRVRLSKRRQKMGQPPSNTRLVVKHRPLNVTEFRMQRYRERMLEPPGEDEDEEEQEEDHDDEDKSDEQADNDEADNDEADNEDGPVAAGEEEDEVAEDRDEEEAANKDDEAMEVDDDEVAGGEDEAADDGDEAAGNEDEAADEEEEGEVRDEEDKAGEAVVEKENEEGEDQSSGSEGDSGSEGGSDGEAAASRTSRSSRSPSQSGSSSSGSGSGSGSGSDSDN